MKWDRSKKDVDVIVGAKIVIDSFRFIFLRSFYIDEESFILECKSYIVARVRRVINFFFWDGIFLCVSTFSFSFLKEVKFKFMEY